MKDFLVGQFNALKTSDRRWLRRGIAVLFLVGGLLGFLPVLGYWMLPLGLALLAVDVPAARRLNRLLRVWWGRLRRRLRGTPDMRRDVATSKEHTRNSRNSGKRP